MLPNETNCHPEVSIWAYIMKKPHSIPIPMKPMLTAPIARFGFPDSATVAIAAPVNVLFKRPQAGASAIKELGRVDKFAHVAQFGYFEPKSRLLASKYFNIPRVAARNLNSKSLERARSGICPRGLVL